jgi:hypothetical protein
MNEVLNSAYKPKNYKHVEDANIFLTYDNSRQDLLCGM